MNEETNVGAADVATEKKEVKQSAESLEKIAVRTKRNAAIKAIKENAKAKASGKKIPPVKLGTFQLPPEAKKAFSITVYREDKGDFKADDVIMRMPDNGYLTPEIEAEIAAIAQEAKDAIVKIEEDYVAKKLEKKKANTAKQIEAIKKQEAALAARKAKLGL